MQKEMFNEDSMSHEKVGETITIETIVNDLRKQNAVLAQSNENLKNENQELKEKVKVLEARLSELQNQSPKKNSGDSNTEYFDPTLAKALRKQFCEADLGSVVSVRLSGILDAIGIQYVWQAVQQSESKIISLFIQQYRTPRKPLNELKEIIKDLHPQIKFGMTIPDFITQPEK